MLLEQTGLEIVEACRRGEPDAFRLLFERYKDRVYTIALRYTGDAAAAEDIAQDTFTRLFARIESFRGEAGFESWLYRVVVNICLDYRRRGARWLPLLGAFAEKLHAGAPEPLAGMMETERNSMLSAALSTLPPDQRMTVVLRYSQEMSYEEIGAAMKCSPGTVASRLNRALKLLEKKLRKFDA